MATVTLRGDELDGDLPGVCVMCGDRAGTDVRLTLWEPDGDGPTRSVTLELPYCGRCRRLRKRSSGGVHEPRAVRIDGPPLAVRLAGVSDDFADELADDRAFERVRPARRKAKSLSLAGLLGMAVVIGGVMGFLQHFARPQNAAAPAANNPPGWRPIGPPPGAFGPPNRPDPFAGRQWP